MMFDPSHRIVTNNASSISNSRAVGAPDVLPALPERFELSNSQSTAQSFVHVEPEMEPPKDIEFHKALEAILMSGTNDLIIRLYEHANSLRDLRHVEHHTVLIPTKEAFFNLGEEACAALETEEGRPHLAAIFRHNMFAHKIILQDTGQIIVVDDLDRGATVDICFLDDHASACRITVGSDTSRLSISDDYSTTDVEMDAYYLGLNIIHITDRVFLPLSAAHFLGIDLSLRH